MSIQQSRRRNDSTDQLIDGLHERVRQWGFLPVSVRQGGSADVDALVGNVEVLPEDTPVALRHLFPLLLTPVLLLAHILKSVASQEEALALQLNVFTVAYILFSLA